jgi:hypothetical protein
MEAVNSERALTWGLEALHRTAKELDGDPVYAPALASLIADIEHSRQRLQRAIALLNAGGQG